MVNAVRMLSDHSYADGAILALAGAIEVASVRQDVHAGAIGLTRVRAVQSAAMIGSGSATLLNALARSHGSATQRWVTSALSVLFLTALTALAAQFSVPLPLTSVPFTLQPMVVLLGGLALGARLGCISQVLYLAAGVAGLPVFAASATLPPGAFRLLGPTGGYLMAYPVAAFVVGSLAERGFDRRYVTSVVAMLVGLAVVYAGGVAWLGLFARAGSQSAAVGLQAALAAGLYPFVAADLVKVVAAAGVLPGLWHIVGRTGAR
jgi:biotin transport system substrate-specific component